MRTPSLVLGLLVVSTALAGPFTPGNVVVYRVGTGSGGLLTTGNAVFLDEYSPGGTLVQSIALPTAASGANKALVASGTAAPDGLLTRSANGNCLVVPGYGRDLGTGTGNLVTTGTQTGGAAIPRVVGRVSNPAAIDTTTALVDANLQSNYRGATSVDCIGLWTSGTAGTTGGGVRYSTFGSTTSTDLTSASFANTRAVVASGGQLYVSASVTNLRTIASVGSGYPTSGAQPVVKLPGLPDPAANGQPYAFFIAGHVLYIADESFGIAKYSRVGSSWVANGTVGLGADTYRGIAGVVNGTTVTLFATRKGGTTATGGGELVTLVDASGLNGTLTGTPTLLATAAGNTAFRGVAMAPEVTITSSAGAHGSISPLTSQVVGGGATRTFTVTADVGYAPVVGGTCGGTLVGNTYTTQGATFDCTVEASFQQLATYTATPSAGMGGTITPDVPQTVIIGNTVAFDVAPGLGFALGGVGGTCGGTLAGLHYTTQPLTANCTVEATFTPLPQYTITPSAGAHGSISPNTPVTLFSGQAATFDLTPAPGYNVAVRGSCGGAFVGTSNTYVTNPLTASCTLDVAFATKLVLFVGNSYTFGRVDPVMSYNTANVSDLTYGMWLVNSTNSNADEPHPWGGIPGVFKKMTDQAGLEWDVSISARNAASLRGHFLNTNPDGWDLRGNMASQRWDAVILQDLSDEPLPPGRGANASLPNFNTYVDKIEAFVHQGHVDTFTNSNARSTAEVFLYETWARPDMIAPNGTNVNGTFYTAAEGLEAMTLDFHNAYFGRAAANPGIADVSPVGDAFLRAVTDGVAMRDPYVPEIGKVNLWHTDYFHPSKYGSYLSALVHFATLTGRNPLSLGPGELAAADLGIAPDIAAQLQRVAQSTVAPDTTPPVTAIGSSPAANAAGWNNGTVTIGLSAVDESNGSGVASIRYTLAGAQTGTGTLDGTGSVTITADGVTTVTYYATDRAGNVEAARTLSVSIDKTAPAITLPAAPCTIWPPNNKMVVVGGAFVIDPHSQPASFDVTVTSSEPPTTPGQPDWTIAGTGLGPRVVSLRASRNGNGPGRVYTITAMASDNAGNTKVETAICTVPHNR